MAIDVAASVAEMGGGDLAQTGGELQGSEKQLASFIAAGDTLGACGEAAALQGAQQMDEATLLGLAKAGVTVRRISPDGICQQVLAETASEAAATLPNAKGPGGRLQQLHADLFSLDPTRAQTARQVVTGYAPAIAQTFANQAGRATTYRLDQSRWRAVLVQPDGSILTFGVNSMTSWRRRTSSENTLLAVFTEHGIQAEAWAADGTESNPFASLITGRWLPSSKAKGRLSAPNWKPPEAPIYDDESSEIDRLFDQAILDTHNDPQIRNDSADFARAIAEEAILHPGAIAVEAIRRWHRTHLHAMPARLNEVPQNWAMDGRVGLHMVAVADTAQYHAGGRIIGRLISRPPTFRTRQGDVAAMLGADPIIAAQIYDLGAFQRALPNEGADMPLAELLTAFQRTQAEKSFKLGVAAAICIAAMAPRGWVYQGGINPRTIDMVLANTVFNGEAAEKPKAVLDTRRQAAAFRQEVNKYREVPTIGRLTGAVLTYAQAARAAQNS